MTVFQLLMSWRSRPVWWGGHIPVARVQQPLATFCVFRILTAAGLRRAIRCSLCVPQLSGARLAGVGFEAPPLATVTLERIDGPGKWEVDGKKVKQTLYTVGVSFK